MNCAIRVDITVSGLVEFKASVRPDLTPVMKISVALTEREATELFFHVWNEIYTEHGRDPAFSLFESEGYRITKTKEQPRTL